MARGTDDLPGSEGPIFEIADASRAGMHLIIQLFGPSQCGKTLTALYLARGIADALAGPKGLVGCMDTEGRARMFADRIPGPPYKVGELTRPFSPDRYLEGIDLFMRYGVNVLVIDSFSHVWEGIGGVLDQAEANEENGRKGLAKWSKPKRGYNRMVSMLLTTRIPLIFCSRAKQPIKIEMVRKNGRDVEEWTPQAWEPIQDKRLKFDMTIVLPMTLEGEYETGPGRMKCPDDLRHLFLGDKLTIETGRMIGQWVAGGSPINPARELLRKQAFDAAAGGSQALRRWYTPLPDEQKLVVRPMIANLQSAARTADDEAEQRRQAQQEASQDQEFTAPFGQRDGAEGEADDADPFGYSDLRGSDDELRVPVSKFPDGSTSWEDTVADMVRVIIDLTDPEDAAPTGRFKRANRETLEEMRLNDRDAWNTVELRLADQYRELREQHGA
jgi:hypothetical protein